MVKQQKKIKKGKRIEKLSWQQECMYVIIILLFLFFIAVLGFLFFKLKHCITFHNAEIVAYAEKPWILLLFLPLLTLIIPFFAMIEYKRASARPLFQKKEKRKRIKYSKKRLKDIKKQRYIIIAIFLAFVSLNILCILLSFFPRDVLMKNGEVKSVNVFNQEKVIFCSSDIQEIVVRVHYHSGGIHTIGRHEAMILEKSLSGKTKSFHMGDFKSSAEFFNFIRTCDKEKIFIDGKENIAALTEDIHLTREETALLQSLQEYPSKSEL